MPRGFLSVRLDCRNPLHHLWNNNGTWWVHYTLHFGNRKRRIRRSLKTSDLLVAIARRDALFARLAIEGEDVPERRAQRDRRDAEDEDMLLLVA
jgi:hypothetical protein